MAEFTCTAVANSFTWALYPNGQQINEEEGVDITTTTVNGALNIRMSTLRVAVTSIDDAANIICTAFTLSPLSGIDSDPVLLQVQGRVENCLCACDFKNTRYTSQVC